MKLLKTIINRGRDFGMIPNSDLFVLLDQPYVFIREPERVLTRAERREIERKERTLEKKTKLYEGWLNRGLEIWAINHKA